MRILSIDPSVTQTGLAFPDKSTSIINPPKKLSGPARLAWLRKYMRFVVGSVQPDLIVLEDYAIGGSHAKAIIPTCEWGGVLRLELFDLSVPFIVVPPQAIKSYCTGKGNAGKDEVGYELSTRTGIVFRNKDESDAFGLGAMVNDHYGNPWVSVPKAWRESAFKQVQWPEGVKDAKTHP